MSELLKPLTQKELQDRAPSIFTTKPSKKVTDKYSFIPTVQVLEDLNKLDGNHIKLPKENLETHKIIYLLNI